jgi:Holliday junction resolvase-like predicted endonuclease
MMLTENDITERLAAYLTGQGYVIRQQLTTIQKGVDLIAKSPEGVLLYVEVKGETSGSAGSARFGKPFNNNQIWSHVSVALMKTVCLLNQQGHEHIRFAMAFPANHENLLQKIRRSLTLLHIDVYLVSPDSVWLLN